MSRDNLTGQILATVPAKMRMPPEIIEAMRWLESHNAIESSGYEYAISLFPSHDATGRDDILRSSATFFPIGWDGDDAYYDPPPEDRRLFRFMYAGEGSVGLWVDDSGKQQFVLLDHWGGQAFGIISGDPVEFLRFLAIGYHQPAEYRAERLTPEQFRIAKAGGPQVKAAHVAAENWPRLQLPSEFADYVAKRYGKEIPRDGSGLVRLRAGQQDAFTRWYASVRKPER